MTDGQPHARLVLDASDLRDYMHAGTNVVRYDHDTESQLREREVMGRRFHRQRVIVLMAALVCAVGWVTSRLVLIRTAHADALRVYASAQFNSGPVSTGAPRGYTALHAALAFRSPPFYSAMVTLRLSRSLSPVGAHFLLLFLQRFPVQMRRVHWDGSPGQLGYPHVHAFCRDWAGWASSKNAFSWLFPTEREFESSIMIRCKRLHPTGKSLMDNLYQGGICHVAETHTTSNRTAADLFGSIVGTFTVQKKECTAQRTYAAASAASNVISAGVMAFAAILSGGMALAPLAGLTAAATVVGATTVADRSSKAVMCTLSEDETRISYDEFTLQDLSCEDA
jgi:hypothetical protein